MGKLFNVLTIADIPGGTVCESAVFKADKVTKKIVEFVYKKYFLSEGEHLERWVDGPDELEDELVLDVPYTIVVRVDKHLVMEHKIPETFRTKVIVAEVNGTTSTKLHWDREREAFKFDFEGAARGSSDPASHALAAREYAEEAVKEMIDAAAEGDGSKSVIIDSLDAMKKIIEKMEDDSDVEY